MTTAKVYQLVEKLFVMLLAGTCGFAVTYLRDINQSLEAIRTKMGIACEQLSAVDATIKSFDDRMAFLEIRIENHVKGG